MGGGDRATLATEIIRQQVETRGRMGEPEEALRTAVGAVELRAYQRTTVCSNRALTNQFEQRSNETERSPPRLLFEHH